MDEGKAKTPSIEDSDDTSGILTSSATPCSTSIASSPSSMKMDLDLAPASASETKTHQLPPEIWAMILQHLSREDKPDLVHCLSVSKTFFSASAAILCRHVELPKYNFLGLGSGVEHSAHHPELPISTIEALGKQYRLHFPSSHTMRAMYDHATSATIYPHIGCDVLAKTHPLRNVQTFFFAGEIGKICQSMWGKSDIVDSYRVIGMLLSERITNLVIEVGYLNTRSPGDCLPLDLSSIPAFRPKRVVLKFSPIHKDRIYPDIEHMQLPTHSVQTYKPSDEVHPSSNFIYRIAVMCVQLAMIRVAEILVVGADQAALGIRGLDAYDPKIPPFDGSPENMNPIAWACYSSQSGHLVSSRYPQALITLDDYLEAKALVDRKVEALKQILYSWIDHCFDPQPPKPKGKEKQSSTSVPRTMSAYYMYGARDSEKDADESDHGYEDRVSEIIRGGDDNPMLTEGEKEAKKEDIKSRIRFITLNEYHALEGNKNESRLGCESLL